MLLYCQAQTTTVLPVKSPAVAESAADSRLRQMETIYQQQLRTRHIPVLGQYLTDLQKQAAKTSDPSALKAEIQNVQAIISGGAVMDLTAVAQELNPTQKLTAANPPPPEKMKRGPITLTPAFAQRIQPTPEGSASPEAAAIGIIEWRIDSLPPGSYEFVLQYACPTLDSELTVTAEFAGQKITQKMPPNRATKDATNYRLLRLGMIQLTKDATGETLRLMAGSDQSKALLIKSFVIAKAKPNE